ncbi:hypothetical protein AAE478_003054 [Parahypoxylon ruwenzoriense]
MRSLALPTSLLFGILHQARVSAGVNNDFSAYPEGSQSCLYDAADQSRCSGNTGQELNECLCTNKGNFIYNTAQCVARESSGDLDAVYETLKNNCAGTGVTVAVSKEAFLAQAAAATASSTTSPTTSPTASSTGSPAPTPTPTTSETPSATAAPGSTISKGGKIGLAIGTSFGAIALGLFAWFVWAYSKRRHRRDSSPPITGPNNADVELSNHNNNNNSSYVSSPTAEYAQSNSQLGPAELVAAVEWKELPAEYHSKQAKRSSGVPLLAAELDTTSPPSPVELPTENYSRDERDGHGSHSPM